MPPAVESRAAPSLSLILGDVVDSLVRTFNARFFRGEMDITQLAGYTAVVKDPMDFSIIQDRLTANNYRSLDDLTKDLRLIVSNAKEYNGDLHPVATAAEDLFARYLLEASRAMDRLMSAVITQSMFTCPKCHLAICSSCKQIEHGDSACDTSSADHELAMLQSFGYKRCPRCKAGVKKMFGCSHMQCLCGAHWCYHCQRSIDDCDGACEPGPDVDDEEEDDYDSELDEEESGEPGVRPQAELRLERRDNVRNNTTENRVVSLDAGGGQRWADGTYDFGEEPEEEPVSQVRSCSHHFEKYRALSDDGINRGDLDRMECNRCFTGVEATRPLFKLGPPKKRQNPVTSPFSKDMSSAVQACPKPVEAEKEAWECTRCRVVVCLGCRNKYEAPKNSRDHDRLGERGGLESSEGPFRPWNEGSLASYQ